MSAKPHILFVESDKKEGARLVKIFERLEITYRWFEDIPVATAHLAEERFDACVLGTSGSMEEVLSDLQSLLCAGSQAPTLLLLPAEEPDIVEKSLRMGAVDVMVKRISPERFARSLRYAIARHSVDWRIDMSFNRDTLTQLPNFTAFQKKLNSALEDARKVNDYEVGVIHLGVDGFKLINNGLGHSAGDELLISIARRLISCLRDRDVVARRGGDEFSILLTGPGIQDSIDIISSRIIATFDEPFKIAEQEVYSSACIGISLTKGQESAEELLQDADIALHKAKRKGRGSNEIFLRTMQRDARERLQLENDLRRSLANRDFILYYQPVINLSTAKVAYFEALVRWNHPERGLVSPYVFLNLAEETGLIVPMGWQLLHQACRQVSLWTQDGFDTSVSVNLSAEQFCAHELLGQLNFCLEVSGIGHHQLKLEITESSLIENQDRAMEVLEKIGDLGLQVYLDDFGTGYSSLAYLEKFPLHGLKIDRAFVMKVVSSRRRAMILQKIIELGQLLSMTVVAEGVETTDELHELRNMRCDMVQGYYFAKPMSAEEVPAFLDSFPS